MKEIYFGTLQIQIINGKERLFKKTDIVFSEMNIICLNADITVKNRIKKDLNIKTDNFKITKILNYKKIGTWK